MVGLRWSGFGQTMKAEDIAGAITYIVTRPRHVAVNEVLIRPTEQERQPPGTRCNSMIAKTFPCLGLDKSSRSWSER